MPVAPVTAKVPPKTVAPVPTVRVLVPLIATDVCVGTIRPPVRVVAPVTARVLAVATAPVVPLTVKLDVSTAMPPLALSRPVNVLMPVTANVELKVVAPVAPSVPPTETLSPTVVVAFTTAPTTNVASKTVNPVLRIEYFFLILILN
jgi:hypothetical protein